MRMRMSSCLREWKKLSNCIIKSLDKFDEAYVLDAPRREEYLEKIIAIKSRIAPYLQEDKICLKDEANRSLYKYLLGNLERIIDSSVATIKTSALLNIDSPPSSAQNSNSLISSSSKDLTVTLFGIQPSKLWIVWMFLELIQRFSRNLFGGHGAF
jgi:hypothetical protein